MQEDDEDDSVSDDDDQHDQMQLKSLEQQIKSKNEGPKINDLVSKESDTKQQLS